MDLSEFLETQKRDSRAEYRLPKNLSSKLVKRLVQIRNVSHRKKLNFLAVGPRSPACKVRVQKDTSLGPWSQSFVQIYPLHVDLGEASWLYKPKNVEGVKPLSDVHLIECTFNKKASWVPVNNLTENTVILKADTHIGSARKLTEYDIPMPDTFDFEINEIDSTGQNSGEKVTSEEEQLSPKKKAEKAFHEKVSELPDDIKEFLVERKQVFIPDTEYGHSFMKIEPIDLPVKSENIKQSPPLAKRRYTAKEQELINTFIETGLKSGLIEQIQSPCASALHVVFQGAKSRIVSDMRFVNSMAQTQAYAFPKPTEILNRLASKQYKYWCKLDMKQAFPQIPIAKGSRRLLAFKAMTDKFKNQYAYRFLNFGFAASPGIFSSVMDNILLKVNSDDLDATCENFFDDIICGARTREAMFILLRRVFARFIKFNVKLGIIKSELFQPIVDFCGFEIGEQGYFVSEKRQKILKDWPDYDVRHKNKNYEKRHLGFYNWHRSLVKNYAEHEAKIRASIKHYRSGKISAETCNSQVKVESDAIRDKVLKTILVGVSKEDTIYLCSDASNLGYGYVCYSDKGIILYGSGMWPASVVSSHVTMELELKAVALSVQATFPFIAECKKLVLKNDNLSGILLMNSSTSKRPISPRALKYLSYIQSHLSAFDYEAVHLSTTENFLADTLSRLDWDEDGCFKICAMDLATEPLRETFASKDEQKKYLEKFHQSTHWNVRKTEQTFKLLGIRADKELIADVFKSCKDCYTLKRVAPFSKLTPRMCTASTPLSVIHIDHVDKQQQKSRCNKIAIICVLCELTNMLFTQAVSSLKVLPVIYFLKNLMAITGQKIFEINSDNAFDTFEFRTFAEQSDIVLNFRPSRHPRAILVEHVHTHLHRSVKSFTKEAVRSWPDVLAKATTSLNGYRNDVTGFSPAYLFYGQKFSPVEGKLTIEESHVFDLELARALKNEAKAKRHSHYRYRKIPKNTQVFVKYENLKNSASLKGEILEDPGKSSCLVKLDGRHRPIRVHKSSIFIEKSNENFPAIFRAQEDPEPHRPGEQEPITRRRTRSTTRNFQ